MESRACGRVVLIYCSRLITTHLRDDTRFNLRLNDQQDCGEPVAHGGGGSDRGRRHQAPQEQGIEVENVAIMWLQHLFPVLMLHVLAMELQYNTAIYCNV